jgi:hypothetical protein
VGNLQIDPESLDSAGQSVGGSADRFFAALEQFKAKIEGIGNASGGDEIGGLIGAAHDEVFAMAMECFQIAAEEIAEAGADIRDFAVQHQTADDETAKVFNDLLSQLEGGA